MKNGLVEVHGDKYWYKDDEFHRDDDLPAIEGSDGAKFWFKNGKHHRLTGPAIVFTGMYEYWYIDDEQIHCQNNDEFLRIVKLKYFL